MKSQVGIWIDHKRAVVVFITAGAEHTEHIASGLEGHVNFSGQSSAMGAAEDQRDHKFAAHLAKYYDKVISNLHEAESIFLFGPGEAKGELHKELDRKGLSKLIVATETTDKLTDPQIVARVRKFYSEHVVAG